MRHLTPASAKKVDQYTQMISLPQLIHQFVNDLTGVRRVVLAVSGGVDSMVLLHATVGAQLPQPLLVVHVNHQLSPFAATWQAQVRDCCDSLGVDCVSMTVHVKAEGAGLEEAARQARYQAIERHLHPGDLVLMAHHQQDQVETFFLRLTRGAGVRGLAGMAPLRDWGFARLGRPFLTIDRTVIDAYARHHGLSWVEDESNANEHFDRNFLRLNVIPLLRRRWPKMPSQVGQAMDWLRESDNLLNEFADADLLHCHPRRERLGVSMEMAPLLRWSAPRRHNLLRRWLALHGYRSPSRKRLAELDSLFTARQDQNPLLYWGDCELRRYRERVYCLPAGWQQPSPAPQSCATDESLMLGNSRVEWISASSGLRPGNYKVVVRDLAPHAQRAHPMGRVHSQSLKKLLQEYGLEPWLRDQVPLIFQNERLVAVGDLWIEKSAAVESGWVPVWSFATP
jgi:tRNA(Ile)-lysidine synthase